MTFTVRIVTTKPHPEAPTFEEWIQTQDVAEMLKNYPLYEYKTHTEVIADYRSKLLSTPGLISSTRDWNEDRTVTTQTQIWESKDHWKKNPNRRMTWTGPGEMYVDDDTGLPLKDVKGNCAYFTPLHYLLYCWRKTTGHKLSKHIPEY